MMPTGGSCAAPDAGAPIANRTIAMADRIKTTGVLTGRSIVSLGKLATNIDRGQRHDRIDPSRSGSRRTRGRPGLRPNRTGRPAPTANWQAHQYPDCPVSRRPFHRWIRAQVSSWKAGAVDSHRSGWDVMHGQQEEV